MYNLLKSVNYHKLCAYNPKTDSTLWLQNYRIRNGEATLFFTSNPKDCCLLVVDLDEVVNDFLGMEFEIIHWFEEDLRLLDWI